MNASGGLYEIFCQICHGFQEDCMKYFARFAMVLLAVALTVAPAVAKKPRPTGLTPEMLKELSQSLKMDSHLTFARNALADNDAAKLTLNRDLINSIDDNFSHRIKDMSITNQEHSGRCWMFAGLNILRPIAAKKLGIKDIEFSENYLFFYDKLEKANMFLEAVMKTRSLPMDNRYMEFLMNHTTPDGGYWVNLAELAKKYGIVPKDVMPSTSAFRPHPFGGGIKTRIKSSPRTKPTPRLSFTTKQSVPPLTIT